jgi:hypothetical protein
MPDYRSCPAAGGVSAGLGCEPSCGCETRYFFFAFFTTLTAFLTAFTGFFATFLAFIEITSFYMMSWLIVLVMASIPQHKERASLHHCA